MQPHGLPDVTCGFSLVVSWKPQEGQEKPWGWGAVKGGTRSKRQECPPERTKLGGGPERPLTTTGRGKGCTRAPRESGAGRPRAARVGAGQGPRPGPSPARGHGTLHLMSWTRCRTSGAGCHNHVRGLGGDPASQVWPLPQPTQLYSLAALEAKSDTEGPTPRPAPPKARGGSFLPVQLLVAPGAPGSAILTGPSSLLFVFRKVTRVPNLGAHPVIQDDLIKTHPQVL